MAHDLTSGRYRFLTAEVLPGRVPLPEDQAHHALQVLRLETGAPVEVFDGRGTAAVGTLERIGKHGAVVHITSVRVSSPPEPRLTIATAVPKGERAEWLIEQCSQLNAWGVQWLACARGVVMPREQGGKMDKWRRLAAESAKQCGRNWVLAVAPLRGVAEVVESAAAQGARVLWLEPRGGVSVRAALAGRAGPVTALVGPEGGWSAEEQTQLLAAAQRGVLTRVRLTETILRIETACAAVAALVMGADAGSESKRGT